MTTQAAEPTRTAWAPVTPRGIAAFAHASMGRLLLVQLVFATLSAVAVVWFLYAAWFPTVGDAIRQLPAQGAIRSRQLDWKGATPQRLAEGHFLAFTVDLDHQGKLRTPAHIEVEFGRTNALVFSLLGYRECAYPAGWTISFNRTELQPWWGAWEPPLLWITAALVILWLLVTWAVLAVLYAPAVWLAGFFANRDLDWFASWKLAGAALMPGALVMDAAILLYGLGAIDLVRLAAVFAGHFVVGWIYLILSPLFVPKLASLTDAKRNPFAPPADAPPPAGPES